MSKGFVVSRGQCPKPGRISWEWLTRRRGVTLQNPSGTGHMRLNCRRGGKGEGAGDGAKRRSSAVEKRALEQLHGRGGKEVR
jgi:hypothetical protein